MNLNARGLTQQDHSTRVPSDNPDGCAVCPPSGLPVPGLDAVAHESLTKARVHSNVRAFAHESFEYRRCTRCGSIHAATSVDLQHYYARYPLHALPDDPRTAAIHDSLLARLKRAGLRKHHTLLDYGAGSGALLRHLRRRGYTRVAGYDRYSPEFSDASVLRASYDFIVSQDVLEHDDEPMVLLRKLHQCTKPGGFIAIGTPNASAIDLARAERYRHTLHAPYHRHIFSKDALLAAGRHLGWNVHHYYPTQYANTRLPFLNSRFYLLVMRALDDTLDSLLSPPPLWPLLARLPQALFWGLFGSFLAEETDIMVVFQQPHTEEQAAKGAPLAAKLHASTRRQTNTTTNPLTNTPPPS